MFSGGVEVEHRFENGLIKLAVQLQACRIVICLKIGFL